MSLIHKSCVAAHVIIVGAGLLSLLNPAYADTDTFTQVGTWSCELPAQPSGPTTCPTVNFPIAFGGTPSVILAACADGDRYAPYQCFAGPVSARPGIWVPTVTPQAFTPVAAILSPPGENRGRHVTGNWIAVGPSLYTGTVIPSYQILTVIYAPPGTNGGHATSSVSYGSGSTTGTTTSASQSFQQSVGVSVKSGIGILGNGGSGSLSFGYTSKTTDTQSLAVTQSKTSTIMRSGPAQDGINHDEDAIYLLLKPTISMSLSSSAAAWTFGDNSTSVIQYVFVGELNGHFPWRQGVLGQLVAAGITATDYPNILASDPLAAGSSTLDPSRFVPANTMFPYEPPATPNDPVLAVTTTISGSSVSTVGRTTQYTYKVGASESGSASYLGMAGATLTNTASWQWTDSSGVSTSSGKSQTASLTIGGPAYGYTGVTEVAVYTDTVYNTFAFVLVPPSSLEVALQGTVTNAARIPLANTEVVLIENSTTAYRTFTNAKGEYVFFGKITGPVTVSAAGATTVVPQLNSPRVVKLHGSK